MIIIIINEDIFVKVVTSFDEAILDDNNKPYIFGANACNSKKLLHNSVDTSSEVTFCLKLIKIYFPLVKS